MYISLRADCLVIAQLHCCCVCS